MEKSIYDLELHEEMVIEHEKLPSGSFSTMVLRVPGGWIYRYSTSTKKIEFSENIVFVPYSDEFNPNKKSGRIVSATVIR